MPTYKPKFHSNGPDERQLESGGLITVKSGGKIVMSSGSTFDDSALSRSTGIILLPLEMWRGIVTNEIPAKAIASGGGGVLAKDTTPIFERINTSTDKALRLRWVATDVTEVQQSFVLPPDWPGAGNVTFKMRCFKGSNTDTGFVVAVDYWEGVGGSNLGGNTAAITATATATVSATIAATASFPSVATVTLTPGSHGTDAFYLLGAWIEYPRKLT